MVEDWKTRNISDDSTMTRMSYISRQFSNLIIACNATSVIFYVAGTFWRHRTGNQTDARELLFKVELPFNIDNASVYITILVIQFIHQTSAGSMTSVFSCVLITLVSTNAFVAVCKCF